MQDSALLIDDSFETESMSIDALGLVADSVICTDEQGRILLFNRAAEEAFGYTATEVIGQTVGLLLPPRYRSEHARQVKDFALEAGGANRLMGYRREVWGRRKTGEEFPAEATVSRRVVNGRLVLTVVHRDITERKQAEEQKEAVARELDHRIGNLLTVVMSLVSLSARSASSVDEFKESLQERLTALAATQKFLRGTNQSITLGKLLLAELAHYGAAGAPNIVIEGQSIVIGPKAAQTLALAFHELATNSTKYGALGSASGKVNIGFQFVEQDGRSDLVIEWREAGGPLVVPPVRRGFGTTLIEQVTARSLGAKVVIDYRPEGLVFQATVPKAKLS